MLPVFFDCLEEKLYSIEKSVLLQSYSYGKKIQDSSAGRIAIIAIPIICLTAELSRIAVDLEKLVVVVATSVASLDYRGGSIHVLVLAFFEHGRNIAGVFVGFFVALVDLKVAGSIFLITESRNLKRILDDKQAGTLYGVAYALSKFFDAHGIEYRLSSGSLLGAVRHKGIIPWDDDIDMMIHPDSQQKFKALIENGDFQVETGMQIVWQDFTEGWQVYHPDSPKGEGKLKDVGLPFIDVFTLKEEDEKYVLASWEQRKIASGDYFTKDEWMTASKGYSFGPLSLKSISDFKPYINRCYGREALDFGFQTIHHENLAKMWADKFNFKRHIDIVRQTGLPRRTYLACRLPITYDVDVYNSIKTQVDLALSRVSAVAHSD